MVFYRYCFIYQIGENNELNFVIAKLESVRGIYKLISNKTSTVKLISQIYIQLIIIYLLNKIILPEKAEIQTYFTTKCVLSFLFPEKLINIKNSFVFYLRFSKTVTSKVDFPFINHCEFWFSSDIDPYRSLKFLEPVR